MGAQGETGAAAIRVAPRVASGRPAMEAGTEILRLNKVPVEAIAAEDSGRPAMARRRRIRPPAMSPLWPARPAPGRDRGQRRR